MSASWGAKPAPDDHWAKVTGEVAALTSQLEAVSAVATNAAAALGNLFDALAEDFVVEEVGVARSDIRHIDRFDQVVHLWNGRTLPLVRRT